MASLTSPTNTRGSDCAARLLAPVAIAATALLVWPPLEHPFSAPKLGALAVAALLACALAAARRGADQAPPAARALGFAWVGAAALSALVGDAPSLAALAAEAASGLWLLGLLHARPEASRCARAVAACGVVIASVALLQAAGVDPFGWAGLRPGSASPRMRVYGTLGNPDFVSAWLGAAVVMVAAQEEWAGLTRLGAVAAMVAGMAATRSFGGLLAVGVAAGFAAVSRRRAPAVALAVAAVALAGVLAASGRSAREVARGRWELWEVGARAVREAPVLGHGPGSVAARWSSWGGEGRQDHVHDEPLDWVVELGFAGAAVRLALVALALWAALRRSASASAAGAGAALAGLMARALVDFPLHRPAESCLFAVLVSLAFGAQPREPRGR